MTADGGMTGREVGDYLRAGDRTSYRLAGNGKAPDFRVGGSWPFRKVEIDRWADANAVGSGEAGKRATGER